MTATQAAKERPQQAPTIPPLIFEWNGETMTPRHPRIADRYFVIGATYRLVEHQERSEVSHRHYFAAINEAFSNLPEAQAERFKSAEQLRKFALIRTGYRDERSVVCASKAEAQRIAAFVAVMDDYAVVTASEAVVTVYTAKSQSMRAMGREAFQASKDAVLDVLAELIGVAPGALAANAGQSA